MARRHERGFALAHAMLALAAAGAVTFVITSSLAQQARSERLVYSRADLDQATVKTTALVVTSGTNPVPAAVTAASFAPSGGGQLPASVTPQRDGFGSPLGYCTGTPVLATDPVFAVVAAGPDKSFQTSCVNALAGTRVGDDQIQRVTVSQVYGGFSATPYHGASVSKESHLGSILSPRAGELRVVAETGVMYVNQSGTVGGWTPLRGGAAVIGLVQDSDNVRRWADGTYAASCKEYRYPAGYKVYRDAVGDGVYRIQPGGAGAATLDVYCDQTLDAGGWTLVARSKPGNTRQWACDGYPSTITFGWLSSTGALGDETQPYNIDARNLQPFTQIAFGGYTTGKTWSDHVYRHTVAEDFLSARLNSHYAIGAPTVISGGAATFWMAAYIGFVSNTTTYHWRDMNANGYGLTAEGWATCYADSFQSGYAGYLNTKQGMIMVR